MRSFSKAYGTSSQPPTLSRVRRIAATSKVRLAIIGNTTQRSTPQCRPSVTSAGRSWQYGWYPLR